MRKESNGSINVYSLSPSEWQNFIQFNPQPESLGIKVNLMNDNSRKVIIRTDETYKVMTFEAATGAAQIKIENKT